MRVTHPVVGADPRVRPLPGSQTPSPLTGEGWGEGDSPVVGADPRVRPLPGSKTPSPSTGEGWGEGDTTVVPAPTAVVPVETGTQGGGGGRTTPANPPHPEPRETVVPAKAGTQGGGVARPSKAGIHREPNSSVVPAPTAVVPAKEGTHPRDPEPGSQLETKNSKLRTLPAPTAPNTTDPNTAAPGRKRQGRHSQKGPGVRAHRGGKGRKTRTRRAHHRRA